MGKVCHFFGWAGFSFVKFEACEPTNPNSSKFCPLIFHVRTDILSLSSVWACVFKQRSRQVERRPQFDVVRVAQFVVLHDGSHIFIRAVVAASDF